MNSQKMQSVFKSLEQLDLNHAVIKHPVLFANMQCNQYSVLIYKDDFIRTRKTRLITEFRVNDEDDKSRMTMIYDLNSDETTEFRSNLHKYRQVLKHEFGTVYNLKNKKDFNMKNVNEFQKPKLELVLLALEYKLERTEVAKLKAINKIQEIAKSYGLPKIIRAKNYVSTLDQSLCNFLKNEKSMHVCLKDLFTSIELKKFD